LPAGAGDDAACGALAAMSGDVVIAATGIVEEAYFFSRQL
jgi:hypothetical protein